MFSDIHEQLATLSEKYHVLKEWICSVQILNLLHTFHLESLYQREIKGIFPLPPLFWPLMSRNSL